MGRPIGRRNVPEDKCKAIYDAICMGTTVTTVAKYYDMPKSRVSNIVRRLESRAQGWIAKKRGRREKPDSDSLKKLESIVIANRFTPLRKIAAIFNAQGTISISTRRSRRYIQNIGFKNRVAVRKPFICSANLVERTHWALRHWHWSMFEWSRIVFTDESHFEVRPVKRNMGVWRKDGERYSTEYMLPTFKSGYELVNVWGAFSFSGRAPLKRIEGTFKNTQYKEICLNLLFPWATQQFGDIKNCILQEDNCGPHRAIAISEFIEEHGVKRMKWPAQSPDLDPIENVWGYMKTHFRKQTKYPKNKDECYLQVLELCNNLPQSYF